ncbi:flagellin N-terminal helical domain-containing protein [Rheinheimera sp. EpRS3]|uniref:flagellin N-terminal helical domain-containing protein n=1 Tax=Rheinheimera sp. EpRS3 TaxID=1712383 RepID=UPI0007487780|nr:flagellin [Rheinheimera sp. EpRS3]KUM52396.1 flagellin [Rheinheimera sp. EpRS3]
MPLVVNTNQSSLASQRLLSNATSGLSTSFERLTSGFRINRAADDAAGLVISNVLTSQVNGLDQAVRNANDAVSLVQVTEGAMDEIATSLQRMRVLTIQSENGINTAADIAAIQQEYDDLAASIQNIADNTEFGGIKLLDGSTTSVIFQIGANAGQKIEIDLSTGYGSGATGLNVAAVQLGVDDAADSLLALDQAILAIDVGRTDLGAWQNVLSTTIRNLSNISENVSASRGRIRDTDYARETTELTRTQIIQQSSTTVLAQANQRPQAALSVLVS